MSDPKTIYLQPPQAGDYEEDGVTRTWCNQRMNDADTKYVRADIHKKALDEIKRLKEIIKMMEEQP